MFFILLACNNSGSVFLSKQADTEAQDSGDMVALDRNWVGHRDISFQDQCNFSIYETGEKLLDETNQVHTFVTQFCPDCEIYRLDTTPSLVECGELGLLPVGGERHRAVSYTDNGLDLWYVYENSSDWVLDKVSTAEGDDSSWSYSFQDSFQAFIFETTGEFSLEP